MNLNEPFVITLSREIGSGGHTIGRILAEKLNVRYSDRDIIENLEKRFNLTADAIEKLKSQKKNWLADFVQFVTPMPSASYLGASSVADERSDDEVTTGEIYRAEAEIIRELANEGSCVIAGRSGFHILNDHPNHLRVFITASKTNRIDRVMRKQGLDQAAALKLVDRIDRARERYIRQYTGNNRYDARNYDLVISTDGHTEAQIADIILSYIG